MRSLKLKNLEKKITTEQTKDIKPFLKWAGGKSALIKEISKFYPSELGNRINKYCEPFVGGGAVLFNILSNYNIENIYISDINIELINTYKTIKYDVEKLIEILNNFQNEFIPLDSAERKIYYYEKRDEFNEYIKKNISDVVYGSALFIFLNRTCFNGLYRVNKKGLFNVPMGTYKNPKICDETNLKNISIKLKNVNIFCSDYEKSIDFIDENTFVYFDPPYRPITKTASFVSYDKTFFGDNEQIKLSEYYKKVSDKGAICLLSNSDPKNIDKEDNFFDDLYSRFKITRINSKRRINSNASKRGDIAEIIISNKIK